jgi:hypothetical protein
MSGLYLCNKHAPATGGFRNVEGRKGRRQTQIGVSTVACISSGNISLLSYESYVHNQSPRPAKPSTKYCFEDRQLLHAMAPVALLSLILMVTLELYLREKGNPGSPGNITP